jgi:hypothetical protein
MPVAGYSGTPLIQKLGIRPGQRICILNAPQGYEKTLGALPTSVKNLAKLGKPHSLDVIHFFTSEFGELAKNFSKFRTALAYDGMLWISWPKKSSGVLSDMDENIVRDFGLDNGLVDVKVAAIDEIWSGLKFVYRLKDRPK